MPFFDRLASLNQYLSAPPIPAEVGGGECTLRLPASHLLAILNILKGHTDFLFVQLMDICGVDYLEKRTPRFDVVYHLLSLHHNQRVRLKVSVEEGGTLPSLTPLFTCANWWEREVFDMFGIRFRDHPHLCRLLLEEDFQGFPLRKDFPLTGHVQVRYDESVGKVVTEPLNLPQAFRTFETLSPWQGPPSPSHSPSCENPE